MPSHQIEMLFLDLALVLLLARGLGTLALRIGQPPVIGEILAGIALGPTLFHGHLAHTLFPADVRPLLTALASVGVALFMFTIGLEIEHQTLHGTGRTTAGAALGSTLTPFVLGLGLATYLLHDHPSHHPATFTVFIALSVSVTAFPVLARILTDRHLSTTPLGTQALTTAAIVDVAAWIALAIVQAAAGGAGHWRTTLAIPYTATLILLIRPLLRRILQPTTNTPGQLSPGQLAIILTGTLLSAAATEAMNLHYIFGAFLFGAIIPRTGTTALRTTIHERTTHITALLLPLYFVVAGLNVNLSTLGPHQLTDLTAILTVAITGKIGGTYLGARTQGMPPRPAATLATLMNTRGLTELIILGVGLQMKLLDTTLYTLMVTMAVLTTAMTGPLLTLTLRKLTPHTQLPTPHTRTNAPTATDGESVTDHSVARRA